VCYLMLPHAHPPRPSWLRSRIMNIALGSITPKLTDIVVVQGTEPQMGIEPGITLFVRHVSTTKPLRQCNGLVVDTCLTVRTQYQLLRPKNSYRLSHKLPHYDIKSTAPVPKSRLFLSHNLSCHDPTLTSPIPKVTMFCLIIHLVMT
jgi:hypothetical protein